MSVPRGPAPVEVRTERRPLPPVDPLSAYHALASRYGDRHVYLLESVAGAAVDREMSVVGFGRLLTVSVTAGTVQVSGEPALVDAVTAALARFVDGAGRLRARRHLWDALRAVHRVFDAEGSAGEFRFGFLAFVGYDAVRYVEEHLPHLIDAGPGEPDLCLELYRGCVRVNHVAGTADLLVHRSPAWPDGGTGSATGGAADDVDDVVAALEAAPPPGPRAAGPASPPRAFRDEIVEDDYLRAVDRSLHHIGIGDIYQVQVGHEVAITSDATPRDVYHRLRERNPSPYMYLTPFAGHTVVGASPELFARVVDGVVTMRPIAGTLAHDPSDPVAAQAAARQLRGDPKEIAEHVMLVDLCRNDIGRICAPDSLQVDGILTVERHTRLLHLVSTVVGQVRAGADCYDVITAMTPAGTVTGAPKIRAMEIIESLERSRRGLYAGALGLIDVGGYVNLALCIRTLVHRGHTYRTRASAGVVADSSPRREWQETLAKLSAGFWAVTGQELAS